jgi:hypothetical protein
MVSVLQHLKENHVHYELMMVAKCVKRQGLAETVPIDDDDQLSLPAILAIQPGMLQGRAKLSNNFDELIAHVPGWRRQVFTLCWEAIELEVEEDIVAWSERVGKEAVFKRIMSLANEIAHA